MRLRKDLAGQGLDAGPDTICWHLLQHHQVTVSPATVARYLARRGLVIPEPRKRPRSSYIRFEADLPNECWQADFTHWQLADGTGTEILTWLDDHSRLALRVTAWNRSPRRTTPATACTTRPKAAPGNRGTDTHDRVRTDTIDGSGVVTSATPAASTTSASAGPTPEPTS